MTQKAIHITKLHKAYRTDQNLAISMSLPRLQKILAKFNMINEKKIKHESSILDLSNELICLKINSEN